MKKFSKLLLGAAILGVGIGGVGIAMSTAPISASAATGDTFQLVTDASTLEKGDLVAIGSGVSGTSVLFCSTASSSNNRSITSAISVNETTHQFISTAETEEFTLGGSTGAWTFATTKYSGTQGYLNATSNSKNNYLQVVSSLDNYAYFKIENGDNSNMVITCTGKNTRNLLRYNSASSCFSCYSSGQNNVFLYKKTTSTTKALSLSPSSISPEIETSATSTISSINFTANHYKVTSSNEAVATAVLSSSTITVNGLALGNTTIIVDGYETTDETSVTASATLSVSVVGHSYTIIKGVNSLKVGSKVIFSAITAKKALVETANGTGLSAIDATISGNSLVENSDSSEFIVGVGAKKDTFTFKSVKTSKFLCATSDSYGLSTQTANDLNGTWALQITSTDTGAITCTSQGAITHNILTYYSKSSIFESSTSVSSTIALYQYAIGSVDFASLSKTGTATQTNYLEGNTFDPTGLALTAVFSDTSSIDVTSWAVWTPATLSAATTEVTGTVTILGVSKTVTQTVTVTAPVLTAIAVTTMPTKTSYVVGEVFDTTGLVITGTYEGGGTGNVTANCTLSIANGTTLSTIGNNTITVTNGSLTTTFDITVAPKVVLDQTEITFTDIQGNKDLTATGTFSGTPTYEVTASETGIISTAVTDNVITISPIKVGAISLTITGTYNSETAFATCDVYVYSLPTSATFDAGTLGLSGSGYSSGAHSDSTGYAFDSTDILRPSSSSNTIQMKAGSGLLWNTVAWKGDISRITISLNKGTVTDVAVKAGSTAKPATTISTSSTSSLLIYDLSAGDYSYFSVGSASAYIVVNSIKVETVADEIASFVSEFNTDLNSTCNNTAPTAIAADDWTLLGADYGVLSAGAKANLKAVNTQTESDEAKKLCVSRYDYVMNKAAYSSFADFMNRFPSRSSGAITVNRASDGQTNIIAIVATVCTLAACSGYFFYKKKRAQ